MLALPSGAYIYQGDELGLPEVEDLPVDVLEDPIWERSGHTDRGRDGCRVPIPWSGQAEPFGFSPDDAYAGPWLPQPANWTQRSVEAQTGDEPSMLELYRTVLRIRREHPALGDGTMTWQDAPAGILAFHRAPGFVCVVNLSNEAYQLPDHTAILLASSPIADGLLEPADAVWLAV
ncbi:DUF3459 domain-containing protein [Streptomyces canus]|uniref:alpha-amylase family glycosyl hydrolase n=1 Tax=Streptomyces canus TaxID=58343 RepID=UPI00386C7720